jgi:hypothetical protein
MISGYDAVFNCYLLAGRLLSKGCAPLSRWVLVFEGIRSHDASSYPSPLNSYSTTPPWASSWKCQFTILMLVPLWCTCGFLSGSLSSPPRSSLTEQNFYLFLGSYASNSRLRSRIIPLSIPEVCTSRAYPLYPYLARYRSVLVTFFDFQKRIFVTGLRDDIAY